MNDNAGGGVRGLRAVASQALLDAVQAAYRIDIPTQPFDLGGSANLNLCFADASNKWVVRVYRPYVTTERLRAIQTVRHELSLAGIPSDCLVMTGNGQPWMSFDGRLVELERYIDHNGKMDTWASLEAGMPILAKIHTVLQGVEVGAGGKRSVFANHIPSSEILPCTYRGTQRIRAWSNLSPREETLANEAEELARRVSSAESSLKSKLPKQLVHGDFWDNNVFLRDGQVVFVTDFDFMGERSRIDDLALTLYFTCLEYFEDPVTDHQLVQLQKLLNAYDRGADCTLTSAERAALPLAIARQPLWSIGGWVAWLDDADAARNHAVGTIAEVKWALRLMDAVERWQEAFTR
jgi:hypothetical protein